MPEGLRPAIAPGELSAVNRRARMKQSAHNRLRARVKLAADTDCPAEAWAYWQQTGGGFKCEEMAHG